MRKLLLALVAVALAAAGPASRAPAQESAAEMQVLLLGTGMPRPDPERAGPSTAIVVGKKYYIVDAGRGVVMRLAATDLEYGNVRAVFLTHLHSDHIEGLPDLFNTTWIFGRAGPLDIYGPIGVREMSDALERFFAADIHIRRDLVEMLPAAGATIHSHTITQGFVYRDADVRVTAFKVDHRPVAPAFGYRFDGHGHSIVISGDTRPSENLIRYAKGVDILVHEAYLPEHFDQHDTPEVAARLKHYHTSADEVGEVAQAAGVKVLVLSHLVPGNADQEILKRASKHFTGKIIIGHDLMRISP